MDQQDLAQADANARREQRSRIIFGILLVVGGGLLFLHHRSIFFVGALWPLILVGIGLNRIAGGSSRRGLRQGLWLLTLGAWFSLCEFHVLRYRDSWPVLLIAFGALVAWGALSRSSAVTCAEVGDER